MFPNFKDVALVDRPFDSISLNLRYSPAFQIGSKANSTVHQDGDPFFGVICAYSRSYQEHAKKYYERPCPFHYLPLVYVSIFSIQGSFCRCEEFVEKYVELLCFCPAIRYSDRERSYHDRSFYTHVPTHLPCLHKDTWVHVQDIL